MRLGKIKIDDLFASVDWCLKKTFPSDYDERCLYTACAIYTILKEEGIRSTIIGGNVGAFTMSTDGCQASVEGFAGSSNDQPSHYWVEVNDTLLDPNISYLPKSSKIPRVPMPMVAWKNKSTLPISLQYSAHIRYDEDAIFSFPNEISLRINSFIALCHKRYLSKAAKKKLQSVVIESQSDLENLAKAGNKWALGALRFESMSPQPVV
ncbi:hypothetical protein [Candidatus Enterovibrio escicola]|uniref:hypothetical protein n=1 Tax=Candidatus Enterovibrio escicola TaxID=1927127 RepID=UPI001237C66A|nr:hypothetical protein [Candidatus Enterovibrio escacola]